MLVTVTVITYNSSEFVLETLESIKRQTYPNLELIISDDCSADNTIKVCKKWLEKNKSRFLNSLVITSTVNTGISANKNRAIKVSSGEWIKSIAGDDTLVEDSIERYVEFIKGNPDVLVLHSNAYDYRDSFLPENRMVEKSGICYRINHPEIGPKEQFQILLRINRVRAGTAFIKRKVFELAGFYDESIRLWEDRPMWLQLTSKGIKLHFMEIFTLNYRNHTASVVKRKSENGGGEYISNHKIYTIREFNKRYLKFLPFKDRMLKLASDKLLLIANKINIKLLSSETILLNKFVGNLAKLSQWVRNWFQEPYR